MIKQLLRKFRRTSSTFFINRSFTDRSFSKNRPFTHKRLTHEQLEPRILLTLNPSGPELLVNDIVPGFQGMDGNVSSVVVSEAAGTIATYAGLGAGTREGIFLRRTDQAGDQSDVVRASTTIRGSRSNAVVAANDTGSTVVVWQGRGLGDKYGIFLQRFDASGDPLSGEQRVNETIGGKQIDPSVAMAADGSFVVTWNGSSESDSAGVYARRYRADGTPLAGEALVNTTTADRQIESSVAMNSSGDYVITWSSRDQGLSNGDASDWDVLGQRFNAAGVRQGGEFAVNTTTAGTQRESSVAMQDDGTFLVVWSSFGQDGDGWAIVGQRFDAAGVSVGEELPVNASTLGHQRHAQIAGAGGKYLVTWQSGIPGGTSGWEVMAQELDATGNAVGSELTVNSDPTGANSGSQRNPAVALNGAGKGSIVWSGFGRADRKGVFERGFQDDDVQPGPNLAPDLATISDQTITPNTELTVIVTATDPNAGDTLTYQLDPTNSPASATITRTDNNTAVIRWTPTDTDTNTIVNFRVLVTDNGEPPLSDAEEFQVVVSDSELTVDLNGPDEAGVDTTATFLVGEGAVSIVDSGLLVSGAAGGTITSATAQFTRTLNGSLEFLDVDLLGTNITKEFIVNTRRLTLSGEDTQENYQRVLRTLQYNNTATSPGGTRTVEVKVDDGTEESAIGKVVITLGTADLVSFAADLAASGTQFFGAVWSQNSTTQRELFEDGAQFLPFTDVTNADRTLNQLAMDNAITDADSPTWILGNGTRLEGVQSLATLSAESGVAIPISDAPFVAPIANTTLLIGSPLHVSLDGYDPNGGPLTYTATTNNPAVTAEILGGNRSARINVAGYGDLVFELFEQRASRPTDRFIDLANDDFYDGIVFHRIVNDFVIQGGDPLGTGTGGSTLGDFDDQFNIDLQHNRSGLLSYAKSSDDTNDSQFFITDNGNASLRNLDFNHSIFGVLVEGESNRSAIQNTAVNGSRPRFDVVMENVEIFQDNENAVLFLKADPGTTGDVTVTVTVTDQQGNTFDREFTVTVQEDSFNGRPFLGDIGPVSITQNTSAQIQLTATDVEGDPFVFTALRRGSVNYTFDVSDSGFLTVTPPADFVGSLQIEARVGRTGNSSDFDSQLITIEVVA